MLQKNEIQKEVHHKKKKVPSTVHPVCPPCTCFISLASLAVSQLQHENRSQVQLIRKLQAKLRTYRARLTAQSTQGSHETSVSSERLCAFAVLTAPTLRDAAPTFFTPLFADVSPCFRSTFPTLWRRASQACGRNCFKQHAAASKRRRLRWRSGQLPHASTSPLVPIVPVPAGNLTSRNTIPAFPHPGAVQGRIERFGHAAQGGCRCPRVRPSRGLRGPGK